MGKTLIIKYKNLALAAAVITSITGITVLLGWIANIDTLKSIHPCLVSMKFNTALGFILLGIALITELSGNPRRQNILPKILASIVGLFAFISFLQLFGLNFAIDQLFIKDTMAAFKGEYNPGRMSPLTSFCFVCCAVAVLILRSGEKRTVQLYQALLHASTLVAAIAFLGYLFSVPHLYNYAFANSMAVHTSILFIIFSAGATIIYPEMGVAGLFTGKEIGNVMARRLIVWIIPAVLLLGFVRNATDNSTVIPAELSTAVVPISFLVICLVCIWITSKELNKIAQKEQLLQENFRMSIEASPYALILSRQNGEIIHVNHKTERLFGYSKEELIGNTTNLIIPEELRQGAAEKRERFFTNEMTVHYTIDDNLYCCTKKGYQLPVEIIMAPVKTSEGTLALSSIIDVTERKQSQELMQNHLRELQQKNQEMEQFSFIASHDLQEPLRTVSNYIMLLEEDYPEQVNGEIKEHLGAMSEAVSRMKKLIRNLLDFGRLGRNKRLSHTQVKTIVAEVLADLNGLLKEHQATVSYNPDELPELYAYDTELRMLFQNLINNAVKFTKKGMLPEIKISCRTIDGYYEFSVADNGIGIEQNHLDNIFNIFLRLHGNDEYNGYGIGLANCKKIAEMHGGKIWAESQPGEGSTFKFTILNLKL